MFDSGISAADMISELQSEIDVAIPISNKAYVDWLNSLEQLLYTEIIKEQKQITLSSVTDGIIAMSAINNNLPSDEEDIRFEDIYTIYMDKYQLIKSNLTSGTIFLNTWYKKENNVGFGFFKIPEKIDIIYFVKPKLKTVSENGVISGGNVMVPVEFIDLVKSKIRGESYKTANEDTIAAKWLNDYNILLENFKAWVESKAAGFGM